MEFCWTLPVIPDKVEECIHQSELAEQNQFDSVLVSSLPKGLDPWVLAARIGTLTESIRLLVAQNTNFAHPFTTGKALHSLNLLANGRADLNVVTGSFVPELAKLGKADDHAVRYRRTKEFVEILQLLRKGPVMYQGEFYELENAECIPWLSSDASARLYVAGSSEEARIVAGTFGDRYVMYAHAVETVGEHFRHVIQTAVRYGRTVRCGLFVDIIARTTDAEAWEAAERMLAAYPPAHRRLNKIFQLQSDSVGVRSHLALQQLNNFVLQPHIWAGLSQVSDSVSVSIVGSYRNVADTIKRYVEVGASFFILSGSSAQDEIQRIGQYVFSNLKA